MKQKDRYSVATSIIIITLLFLIFTSGTQTSLANEKGAAIVDAHANISLSIVSGSELNITLAHPKEFSP